VGSLPGKRKKSMSKEEKGGELQEGLSSGGREKIGGIIRGKAISTVREGGGSTRGST